MFYRKYRPQTWIDLDNKKVRDTLGKAVLENNFASAYLLIGSRGTGKTTTARLIAKTVNCTDRKKGEEPCNKCDSCIAVTAGSSLDVIEIDAASNTGVDDIRDLREKVRLAPAKSKYKVYIIDEVHMLSNSAFNALLKTLEEPPAHVIFVLATTDPQKLPETIVSRCLVYDFGKAASEEIKHKLKKIAEEEKVEISEEVISVIVEKARGSHRDAQKLFEQLVISGANPDEMTLGSEAAEKILNCLAKKDKEKALEEINKYAQSNGKFKDLISEMIGYLRDILLSGNGEVTREDADQIIRKLLEANSLMPLSPIPSLPLEIIVVEWCGETPVIARSEVTKQSPSVPWDEIVAATKTHNHSLHAFLKAAKPRELKDEVLVIEVFYKFHKEKLEEKKNRDILEKVISDIMGQEIKVKFELGGEK